MEEGEKLHAVKIGSLINVHIYEQSTGPLADVTANEKRKMHPCMDRDSLTAFSVI